MTADAVGGIWTYAVDLGQALGGLGVAVELAVIGPGLDAAKRRQAAEAGLSLTEVGGAPEWLARDAAELATAGEAVASLARTRGADLVHLNHPALAADTPFGVPVLAACHSCVATWWDAVRGSALPASFLWQAGAVGRGYRAAAALVAPSRAFAEDTRRRYGLTEAPIVVPNGRAPAASRVETDPPAFAAFTAGRLWDEGKNAAVLDRVAAALPAPFEAAGPLRGPHGAAADLRHLRPVGTLSESDLRARLAQRPVYVSAAFYEPFGLSVLEAAQAGCALVLSDIPTFRELWDGAALFAPPRDADAFEAAIRQLLADPDVRARQATAARRRASRHGLDALAGRMAGLYDALLSAAPGEGRAA